MFLTESEEMITIYGSEGIQLNDEDNEVISKLIKNNTSWCTYNLLEIYLES